MISTIKNVNTSGPIKDLIKNLSTFFTRLLHLKCKTTAFLRVKKENNLQGRGQGAGCKAQGALVALCYVMHLVTFVL
jgi:hypothetical protein